MSRKPGRTADKGSGRRGIPQDDDGWTVVRRPGLGPVRIRVGANEPQEPPEELEGGLAKRCTPLDPKRRS